METSTVVFPDFLQASTQGERSWLKVNKSIILDLPVRILLKVNDRSSDGDEGVHTVRVAGELVRV